VNVEKRSLGSPVVPPMIFSMCRCYFLWNTVGGGELFRSPHSEPFILRLGFFQPSSHPEFFATLRRNSALLHEDPLF
jgi:hypothetical protein